ncbi:MAG TPA: peroxiredoxin [Jiangellales bacterium]|nr:peroxiredoxin [Jiangellales bacterium]
MNTPAVGSAAPDFELRDQHGASVRLADLLDRYLVLVFFPFAFTGVCTDELRELRGGVGADAGVVAVSCDSKFTLRAYGDANEIDYPLLSDFWPHGDVARRYGVFDEARGCALRGTFVIDTSGVIRWSVVNAIPDARDVKEYRKVLDALVAA